MQGETLAERLGIAVPVSPLLAKARDLGLARAENLEKLAVSRGLRYYDLHGDSSANLHMEFDLSNEELAVALLSPAAAYSPLRVRIGAAMLAAEGNRAEEIARLAKCEHAEVVVGYIAGCGRQVEPENAFWKILLSCLPADLAAPLPNVLPHRSRFVAMTGLTRHGKGNVVQWIRPMRDGVGTLLSPLRQMPC